jgi:peptidyl-prolyl cis-trans isomerase D
MVMRTMRNNIGILKWMFVVLLAVFGIGIIGQGALGSKADLANAAAVVDGVAIPQQRYSRVLSSRLENARRNAGGELSDGESLAVRKEVMNSLVDEALAGQHAKDLGQSMTEAEFRDAVFNDPSLKDEKGNFDARKYQQILMQQAQEGDSVDEVEAQFIRGMLLSKVRGFWDAQAVLSPAEQAAAIAKLDRQVQAQAVVWDLAKLKGGLTITDEDLHTYYSRYKQRWAKPSEYKLKQILIRADFGSATATAKAKAEGILAKLKAGADFKALASTENADEAARKNAGDLGTLKKEDLRHPELQQELNFIKVGGYSQVVQTSEGFHILKLESKTAGFEPTFENTKLKAKDDLGKERAAQQADKLARLSLSELKSGKLKTLADAAKAHNGSLVSSSWFDRDSETALGALGKDKSFANQCLSLDLHERMSSPVSTPKAVAIAEVTAERAGKPASKPMDAATRQRIALGEARAKKSQDLFDAWIAGLKKTVVIKDQSGVLAAK